MKSPASIKMSKTPSTLLFSEVASSRTNEGELDDSEWTMVQDLYSRSDQGSQRLQDLVTQALPNMSPKLIIKLRKSESASDPALRSVAQALATVLDASLMEGRAVLAELLGAGEIRKLDAAIGKSAREGKLNMAFFQVLNMNMSEAAAAPMKSKEGAIFVPGQDANRMQILQHIYTRCQEEVEKTVPPGVALLNKLLRTDVDSIRANQLQYYLCPQPHVIKTPDGKEITLDGAKPVLVSPMLLVDALAEAVKKIRTVEMAGGVERASAASLVESCRQIAIQARAILAKEYGANSDILSKFQDGLQPVFRPDSAKSEFIQGEQ
jgi:hypothetical protein